jgi:hypothetical protein
LKRLSSSTAAVVVYCEISLSRTSLQRRLGFALLISGCRKRRARRCRRGLKVFLSYRRGHFGTANVIIPVLIAMFIWMSRSCTYMSIHLCSLMVQETYLSSYLDQNDSRCVKSCRPHVPRLYFPTSPATHRLMLLDHRVENLARHRTFAHIKETHSSLLHSAAIF